MQHIDVPGQGRYEFDVDVYEAIWNETRDKSEVHLRARVAEEAGYDSIRDVQQELSRFELVGMLAEFETARINH